MKEIKTTVTDEDFDRFWSRLHKVKDELSMILAEQGFWDRYGASVSNCKYVAAYGVGSFTESRASLFQLCLLLLLIDRLGLTEEVDFHEPQLSSLDVAVLERLGFLVNSVRLIGESTNRVLCYMPHCDRVLYEQVLHELVVQGRKFTLLSNLLSTYGTEFDTWSDVNRYLQEEPIFIWKQDADKFLNLSEAGNLSRFKPKYALSSAVIPFEAFNDLGLVSRRESTGAILCDLVESFDESWDKLDRK